MRSISLPMKDIRILPRLNINLPNLLHQHPERTLLCLSVQLTIILPSCCHQPLCCQHCSYRSHYRENEQPSPNDPNIESSIAGLQAQVTLLSEDTKSLHVALLKIQEHCNQSRVPSATPQESAENMRDTNETNSAHASDDSMVSMEEFIDGDDNAS